MTKRHNINQDCTNIEDPPFKHLFPILKGESIDCQCCDQSCQLQGDDFVKVFRWHPYTPIHESSRVKTIYCQACLEHFGALECPFIRGVECYKKCKPEILAKIKEL